VGHVFFEKVEARRLTLTGSRDMVSA
jgi:hypothetical protein